MTTGTYRHIACFDMDMEVLHCQYKTETYIKVKVLYFNRHNGLLLWEKPEEVKILTKDLHKWIKVG